MDKTDPSTGEPLPKGSRPWPWGSFPDKTSVWDSCLEEYDRLCRNNADLLEALQYLVDIGNRMHSDDYQYDDGWDKAREVIARYDLR